ncbi:MAG: hypothetical protein KDE27_33130 [Planctomycetes bacterium]|nr:hypothetical protein [Planctomycetota bacterium]
MKRAFPVLALVAVAAGCSFRSTFVQATIHDAAVGQARLETLDRERIAFACYKDGKLRGAEAAYELQHGWARQWIDDRTPVDHPELPVWQSRLRKMRDAAAAGGADPEPLLQAAADFPFSDARCECFEQWVGADPERAARLLDDYARADPSRDLAATLTALALRTSATDERLSAWLLAMAAARHREAAQLVAHSDGVGPVSARVVLRELDVFPSNARRELYEAVVANVLGDPDGVALAVTVVDDLPSSDEAPAMLTVLRSPRADRELGHRVLRALDDFRSSDREELYYECARLVAGDPRGADALVAALSELPSNDRFGAVRQLLDRNPDADLVAGLLRAADDLPSRDRPRLIEAALRQPHWDDRIERAALDAVSRAPSSTRSSLREAVASRTR